MARRNDDRSLDVVTAITVSRFEQHHLVPDDEGVLLEGPDATAFLQAAMDAAWEHGLRPSRLQEERHLMAHLTDMREITWHLLKMNRGEGASQ